MMININVVVNDEERSLTKSFIYLHTILPGFKIFKWILWVWQKKRKKQTFTIHLTTTIQCTWSILAINKISLFNYSFGHNAIDTALISIKMTWNLVDIKGNKSI